MQITVDDHKTTIFVQHKRQADALALKVKQCEKELEEANNAYNTAKIAAQRGMGPWDAVGALHVVAQKANLALDKANNENTEATNNLQAARNVYINEVLRAAEAAVLK